MNLNKIKLLVTGKEAVTNENDQLHVLYVGKVWDKIRSCVLAVIVGALSVPPV